MKGPWTAQELSDFVKNPKAMVPGTTMSFAGIPRASERADLIAYLNSKSDNPQNLTRPRRRSSRHPKRLRRRPAATRLRSMAERFPPTYL